MKSQKTQDTGGRSKMLSMREFGELIATKRKEFGYTQETFAGKLEITPQAVSKWENGVSQT